MKFSLFLTIAICAVFAWFQWRKSGEVAALRDARRAVEAEISMAGLDPQAAARGEMLRMANAEDGRNGAAATESAGAAREKEVRGFVRDLVAFATEMEAMRESRREPDMAARSRMLEIMDRFLSLTDSDLDVLVDELVVQDITPKMRSELIGGSLMMMAQNNPEATLRLLARTEDMLAGNFNANWIRQSCAMALAAQDPAKAAAWLERMETESPDQVEAGIRGSMIGAMADRDPVTAWRIAMKGGDTAGMLRQLGAGIRSDAARDVALALLRQHVSADPANAGPVTEAFLRGLGTGLVVSDFETASGWLANAELDEGIRDGILAGVLDAAGNVDPKPWLDWMQRNISEETAAGRIDGAIRSWTRRDFNAVGEWLNSQPQGALRNSATRTFAETLAPYEPEAAAQWAVTLPDGPEREGLLSRIYQQWSAKDAEAAAAFAGEHGISPPPVPDNFQSDGP